jgi:GDP-4-dehydro-6-deoxy-D-mannose reductase
MRCLITGISGFAGRHLTAHLLALGHDVTGIARFTSDLTGLDVPIAQINQPIEASALAKILNDVQPQWVFHLAGFASPAQSLRHPHVAWQTNLGYTQALYDALQATGLRPRVLYVSSGLIYGDPPTPEHYFREADELHPATPYAASKAAADLLSYQQTRNPGLDIVRVRPFNHIGPGHSAEYAAANFAKQIAAIQLGHAPPIIRTGDLSHARDLTDVRDVVQAYVRLLEVGVTGEAYNVASGTTITMRELVQRLIALAGLHVEVHEQPDPMRRSDTACSKANITKVRDTTGWTPRIALERTLADLLVDWQARLREA